MDDGFLLGEFFGLLALVGQVAELELGMGRLDGLGNHEFDDRLVVGTEFVVEQVVAVAEHPA